MTLEERVGTLERRLATTITAGLNAANGAMSTAEEVRSLKAQLAELDVMVISIHQTLKDIQESI